MALASRMISARGVFECRTTDSASIFWCRERLDDTIQVFTFLLNFRGRRLIP